MTAALAALDQAAAASLPTEDADEGYIRRVTRVRVSSVYRMEGRPVDENVLAALERASGAEHITDARP